MKHSLLILFFLSCFSYVNAKHITGGEMIYDYAGPGSSPNSKYYRITLRLFRDENCSGCAAMPQQVIIGIYNNDNNQLLPPAHTINLGNTQTVPINPLPPCITNAPSLSYMVGTYILVVELPDNVSGYTAAYQTCCRIDGIRNVPNSTGATYICMIPGMGGRPTDFTDNSPRFAKGISVICYNKPFTLDFSATDPDSDSLVYSFCDAFDGGAATDASPITPSAPPYNAIQYINGYTGNIPLGTLASINPRTGIISGIAPATGKYVVSVCISSYRNGNYVSEHRKDFIVTVAPCDFAGAQLQPSYLSCDGRTFNFENLNNSPSNITFFWDFGDPASGAQNTSTSPNPPHTFSDTGTYLIRFYVNRGDPCADSTTAILRTYPGYIPGINAPNSMCKNLPVQFHDGSVVTYGANNHWHWDFGDPSTTADTSNLEGPTYTYSVPGKYYITLDVASDKGCFGSVRDSINIVDRAPLEVTNDTLICSIDNLQLTANTSGVGGTITWSPNYNINDIHSFNPIVHPTVTTTYNVLFQDNFGCSATDEVKVNVVDFVTLSAFPVDTTICLTDPITLRLNSDGLHFEWTPAATLNDAFVKEPVATPVDPFTRYHVKGTIGGCSTEDDIDVTTVPYPIAQASDDLSVCFGTSAFLHASGGSIYSWTPTIFLDNPNSPDPVVVRPTSGVRYVVAVRDILGCPKPVRDTVVVTVVKIIADAGPRDTSVVIDQPLQLSASGGVIYLWTPPTWLNDPNIQDPIALPQDDTQYVVKVSNEDGCFGLDTIRVHLFNVLPDVFIPNAFTPNGDGTNDIFRPKALGLKSIDLFRIYNRWGQLLFETKEIGKGWDGNFGGSPQGPGTYVWYAEGTDYKNIRIFRKGYVVLIR